METVFGTSHRPLREQHGSSSDCCPDTNKNQDPVNRSECLHSLDHGAQRPLKHHINAWFKGASLLRISWLCCLFCFHHFRTATRRLLRSSVAWCHCDSPKATPCRFRCCRCQAGVRPEEYKVLPQNGRANIAAGIATSLRWLVQGCDGQLERLLHCPQRPILLHMVIAHTFLQEAHLHKRCDLLVLLSSSHSQSADAEEEGREDQRCGGLRNHLHWGVRFARASY
mmetsp:Transcript_82344/g.191206  ORF Transcript_82344/g.191206 Transcript_82344/m.191206 type:complete len:225 (-) Transcript_82344:17-691(-)